MPLHPKPVKLYHLFSLNPVYTKSRIVCFAERRDDNMVESTFELRALIRQESLEPRLDLFNVTLCKGKFFGNNSPPLPRQFEVDIDRFEIKLITKKIVFV